MNLDRRSVVASLLAIGVTAPGMAEARGPFHAISRELARELAKAYSLNQQRHLFNRLFDLQSAFRGLDAWPETELVVSDAVSALRRVLDGESLDREGFRRVIRRGPQAKAVVFSDHHILPDANRQSAVWRNNRDLYVRLLEHYGAEGYTVVENGDVEDLVVLEPTATLEAYTRLLEQRGRERFRPFALLEWFREDPLQLRGALAAVRRPHRQHQLDTILSEPANQPYYRALEALAASGKLVRLAGNHDAVLQTLQVPAHLVPNDVLVIEGRIPTAILHGNQFDAATNPAVAPFYGEVVSECLGIWYQGPDRTWSRRHAVRILDGGFPNRLSTHSRRETNATSSFLQAILANRTADDEEWAAAWETMFGHPIAWEYGAPNWAAAVRSPVARPAELMEDAMAGRQFFKYRHLDEWQLVQAMQQWNLNVRLVLGHSHEVRSHTFGEGFGNYYNSGAVGRFFDLVWALELDGGTPQVVGWYATEDRRLERYRFELRDAELFSYFEAVRDGGAA